MTPAKSYADLLDRYGVPSMGAWENDWLTLWRSETWSQIYDRHWCLSFTKMYVNKDIVMPLDMVFVALDSAGLIGELKTFDGCFNIRDVRGRVGKSSIHSWGLALDFNALENPLGGPVAFSREFLDVWRGHGWTCGADFQRLDGQHFQYCSAF